MDRASPPTFDYDAKTGTLRETHGLDAADRRAALARLDVMATLLDSAFVLPGNIRVGIDAMVGLVPIIGDFITTAMSAYIVYEARRLGAPRWLVARMAANVAIDGLIGAIPLAGDAFDILFRANRRNIALLRKHLERQGVV